MLENDSFDKLNWAIYEQFDRIIELFSLQLECRNDGYEGVCPIHDGADNVGAFRIYNSASCWCFSKQCREKRTSMVSLLQDLIEKHEGYKYDIDHLIAWFVDKILNGNPIDDLIIPEIPKKIPHVDKIFFANEREWRLYATPCPSPNYIKLGFDKDLVAELSIGECHVRSDSMFNRIVVPVFNLRRQVIGYTGRSMYPKCKRCGLYHSDLAPCPTTMKQKAAKWYHKYQWKTSHSLYCWDRYNGTDTVNVVESVGNTLRCLEAGIVAHALFGAKLSVGQAEILYSAGVRYINWIVDNDQSNAGLDGAIKAQNKFKEQFRFKIIEPPKEYNDIADMDALTLRQFLRMKEVWE